MFPDAGDGYVARTAAPIVPVVPGYAVVVLPPTQLKTDEVRSPRAVRCHILLTVSYSQLDAWIYLLCHL
jgi:1-acyl-sn-glycerol-3-phosphate acyltransferase